VWSDPAYSVSAAADALVGSSKLSDCLKSQLPYGETRRSLQIDIVVYDTVHRSLRTYEVKRGNGEHDAGKVRSIMRDFICTHVLLKSYGHGRGHDVDHAEAKIIYYYGVRSVPAPLSLVREELDEHFEYPVVDADDAALHAVEQHAVAPRHREVLATIEATIGRDTNVRARIARFNVRFNWIAFAQFLDTQLRGYAVESLNDDLPLANIAVALAAIVLIPTTSICRHGSA
jgi:hypothetical protein